jgi:hypothetical protein
MDMIPKMDVVGAYRNDGDKPRERSDRLGSVSDIV